MTSTMKRATGLLAVLAAAILALAVTVPAWAAQITINAASDTGNGQTDTTAYTWYRIMDADIETAPTQDDATQSGGEVSYYVTTEDRAAQLEGTTLFNVVRVGTTDKWYVELKDKTTSAATIAEKFAAMDLTKFESGDFEQSTVAGTATSGEVAAGYYYVTSTAGTNAVIQTLSKVTIDEKNTFPTVTKTVAEANANAQIGDDISYTIQVTVPGSANDAIVLTDEMTAGLTFKSIDSVKAGTADVAYTAAPNTAAAITANGNKFTITFDAATVKANQSKTITIEYTAVLNNKAVVGTPDTNTVTLAYGQNYTSKPQTVETYTYKFDFDKVDGADTAKKLTGAEFQLTLDGETSIELIEVTEGETYRIAMSEDTATPVTTIKTTGKTITINGLDSDVTYQLVETKAPTSYNKLADPIPVTASNGAFAHQDIQNNKGSVLPSTGGIGTTIFYVIGGILIAVAAIFLITRKRVANARKEDEEI